MDGQPSEFFFFEWLAKVRLWSLQLFSFLVGLRTYQHPDITYTKLSILIYSKHTEASEQKYSDLILRVLDCILTVLFGVYLVLWLFELVL